MADDSVVPGPIVRDFLYVDVGRVRSLLAQVAGGAPQLVEDKSARLRSLGGTFGIPPFGLSAGSGKNSETTETRSLTDLTFVLFEEAAEAVGLLTDVTEMARREDAWRSGELQSQLEVSQVVRVTGATRFIDPRHFEQTMAQLDQFADLAAVFSDANAASPQQPAQGGGANKRTTPKQAAAKKQELLGSGMPADALPIMGKFIGGLLRGGVWMRTMPCGPTASDCSFGGLLLDRSEYIEPEREALFGRYGADASDWTVVAIVSRFALEATASLPLGRSGSSHGIDRLQVEEMAVSVMSTLEQAGVSDAPRSPSISVTPLAVYRPLITKEVPSN